MISSDEYEALIRLLQADLPASADGARLLGYVGPEAADRVPTATHLRALARWIVDEVLRQPTPDRFVFIVKSLDVGRLGIASLVALADGLDNGAIAWAPLAGASLDWAIDADPLTVAPNRPFIDRRGFRQLLPRAGACDTPACTVVSGERFQGKSYLKDFCLAFSGSRGGRLAVAYTRFPESGAYDGSARIYALEIAEALSVSAQDEPPEAADDERDALGLANWIGHYQPERAMPALVIFDEFGKAEVSDAQHRFIIELARLVQTDGWVRRRLRLILIDYPVDRLSWEGIVYEPHVLELVESTHIADWLRKTFPGRPPFLYENSAARIQRKLDLHMAGAPPGAPMQRMKLLDLALRGVRL